LTLKEFKGQGAVKLCPISAAARLERRESNANTDWGLSLSDILIYPGFNADHPTGCLLVLPTAL
jgi:hypothetical protein